MNRRCNAGTSIQMPHDLSVSMLRPAMYLCLWVSEEESSKLTPFPTWTINTYRSDRLRDGHLHFLLQAASKSPSLALQIMCLTHNSNSPTATKGLHCFASDCRSSAEIMPSLLRSKLANFVAQHFLEMRWPSQDDMTWSWVPWCFIKIIKLRYSKVY